MAPMRLLVALAQWRPPATWPKFPIDLYSVVASIPWWVTFASWWPAGLSSQPPKIDWSSGSQSRQGTKPTVQMPTGNLGVEPRPRSSQSHLEHCYLQAKATSPMALPPFVAWRPRQVRPHPSRTWSTWLPCAKGSQAASAPCSQRSWRLLGLG